MNGVPMRNAIGINCCNKKDYLLRQPVILKLNYEKKLFFNKNKLCL
jgi:hypothetical protein